MIEPYVITDLDDGKIYRKQNQFSYEIYGLSGRFFPRNQSTDTKLWLLGAFQWDSPGNFCPVFEAEAAADPPLDPEELWMWSETGKNEPPGRESWAHS